MTITIPRHELQITFARSSGPGGQNVNKVNTKAILKWSVVTSPSITPGQRQRFLARYGRRINEAGELVLSSQVSREQSRNIADCIHKLHALLAAVATPPPVRKKSATPAWVREARLREKRNRSQRKQRRRPPSADAD